MWGSYALKSGHRLSYFEAITFDDRVGQEFAAHLINLFFSSVWVGFLKSNFYIFAGSDVLDRGKAKVMQCSLYSQALRVVYRGF